MRPRDGEGQAQAQGAASGPRAHLHVLADGVVRVELVADVAVVLARHTLADGRLHQPRERGQHVDRRVDLPVVQLPVDVDLALGNVARQVGDGVRDVVVGHGEDGELRDRARAALDAAGALVDGRQVRVHIAGVAAAAGHLLACGGHLAQGVGVPGGVGMGGWVGGGRGARGTGRAVWRGGWEGWARVGGEGCGAYEDMSVAMTRTCLSFS